MAQGSTSAIYTAAGANLAIAVAKFVASTVTGSAAMFAEGLHSLVDTTNQILLLVGIRRAAKPADARHPFGYGRELYFWAFVVALLIFLGGGVFAITEGWHKMFHPEPVGDASLAFIGLDTVLPGFWINVGVLVFAIFAEGYSCWVALKQFWMVQGNVPAIRAIRNSKDPAIFTILVEDFAALFGLIIALVGVVLAHVLELPILDGAASVAIGVVLIAMAGFLMFETHALLIGEAADPDLVAMVHRASASERGVNAVNEVRTQHMGASDVLVNVSLDVEDSLRAGDIEAMVSRLERRMRDEYPKVGRIFVEIQSRAASQASEAPRAGGASGEPHPA